MKRATPPSGSEPSLISPLWTSPMAVIVLCTATKVGESRMEPPPHPAKPMAKARPTAMAIAHR
ncbi:MAG: hypothetical protein M5U28_14370 [Sandaracinaceae bacterium]|nr:hypothetical protein [Sandaracinaceae bacterium]